MEKSNYHRIILQQRAEHFRQEAVFHQYLHGGTERHFKGWRISNMLQPVISCEGGATYYRPDLV